MCGRYTLSVDPEELWEEFGLDGDAAGSGLVPRYNIAPTQLVPVIAASVPGQIVMLRWGLIPGWARDPSVGNRMINARAETLAHKPSFREAYGRRRCLVLADGFFEWRRDGKVKTPFLIREAGGRPLAFAGLWETWRPPEGEPIRSCTIVTTEATGVVAEVHGRMPAILSREARGVWQDMEATRDDLGDLLRPGQMHELVVTEVAPLVNSPSNDVPACIAPLAD